jgi:hypothetical protein
MKSKKVNQAFRKFGSEDLTPEMESAIHGLAQFSNDFEIERPPKSDFRLKPLKESFKTKIRNFLGLA